MNGSPAVASAPNPAGAPSRPGAGARITLVSLYNTGNLGLRYMIPFLKQAGHQVQTIYVRNSFVNDAVELTADEERLFVEAVGEFRPDVVGFSVAASAYASVARRLTELLHAAGIGPVIWGGMHTMILPEKSIQDADMICLSEGDYPMLELANALAAGQDYSGIQNLWLRRNGEVIRNPIRPLPQNLDLLPLPDFTNEGKVFIQDGRFDRDPQPETTWQYHIQGARGCPYSCWFCSNSVLRSLAPGRYVRRFSVDHLMDELEHMRRHLPHVTTIVFADETFLLNRPWLEEFARQYPRRIGLPFIIQTTPRDIKEEPIALLAKVGLVEMAVGIQSGSERVRNEIMHRNISNEEMLAAARVMHRHKIRTKYDLIFDNPFEKDEDRRQQLELLLSLPVPFEFCPYSMTWIPNVPMTKMALAAGLITPDDVEDVARKILRQWSVGPDFPRSDSELFWILITSLTGKSWIPRRLIRRLSQSEYFRQKPRRLLPLVRASTLTLWFLRVFPYLRRGQISWLMVRQGWTYLRKAAK